MRRKYTEIEKEIMQTIAINLKGILKRKGMSQKDLAELTGLSTSAISDYANAKTLMSPGIVHMFANALKVSKGEIDETYLNENSSHSTNEQELINKIELSDEELIKEFAIEVDGRQLSLEEMKKIIAQVRFDRQYEGN